MIYEIGDLIKCTLIINEKYQDVLDRYYLILSDGVMEKGGLWYKCLSLTDGIIKEIDLFDDTVNYHEKIA